MWFGIDEYLLKYDGETWERIPIRAGRGVKAIEVDEKGRVWVGGDNEFGYLRPIPPSESKEPVPLGERGPNADRFERIATGTGELEYISLTPMVPDSLGHFDAVWNIHARGDRVFFNSHSILFTLDQDSLTIHRPRMKFYRSHKVDGEIWIQDKEKGLYRIRKKDKEESAADTTELLQKLPGTGALSENTITGVMDRAPGMLQEEEKEVLVATRRNGLYKYRYGGSMNETEDRVIPIGKKGRSFQLKAQIYHATNIDPEKNPWGAPLVVSTIRKGAALLDTAGRPVYVLDQDKGLTANLVWRTIRGPSGSGTLWSATNKGVTRWTPGDPRSFAREGEAFSGAVNDITRYQDRLLLGTNQGVYFRERNRSSSESEWEWKRISGTTGQCFDLLCTGTQSDGKGSLLGVVDARLLELRPAKGRGQESAQQWEVTELSDKLPYTLTSLPSFQGREWIASAGKTGIIILSQKEGQGWRERIWIRNQPEIIFSLQAKWTDQGTGIFLWAGLPSQGGFRVRLDSSLFSRSIRSDSLLTLSYDALRKNEEKGTDLTSFVGEGEERKGLPEGQVRFFPLHGRVVAGINAGLYRVSQESKGGARWIPDSALGCLFTDCSDPSKPTKGLFRVEESQNGEVWLQSHNPHHLIPRSGGGYRIDSIPFKGMDMGVVRDFHPESEHITWFGGDNGLAHYDRNVNKNFERSYHALIKEVSTHIKDTARDKVDSILFGGFYRKPAPEDPLLGWQRAYEQPRSFVPALPYDLNGLTFRFTAPYYEKQEKLSYKYRLVGFNEEWSQWMKETRKEYTNLPEGTYTFKLKAKNVYGVESEVAEYRFKILPPWYRTWTAYGGYTVAGIGFIWLLLWFNSRRLLAQKVRLERIVEDRTQEIREQKEQVEKKNQALEEANETISKQKKEVEEQKEKVEEQQRETEKQKQEVERAHDELEESHREITASIDYAQKIQNALLQSEEYASGHLPEHFILFKPQATVSGDFYWAKEQGGHLYFAAIDCTGHGVPGAFMSMLGINQLNEIMAAKELPTPGEVLTELRERVVAELSSGDPEGGAKDGMDAAMVKIPITKAQKAGSKRIEFAGANNPLYVVKKGIADVEATHVSPDHRIKPFKKSSDGFEIKGDKMAVGYEPDVAEAFTTVELEVPSNAMLYMFSDGYADQFGGPKGKKFRYGPFKELLARVHTMRPEEQKQELDRVFEEWKQGQEQIDDVVVVGIRIAERVGE